MQRVEAKIDLLAGGWSEVSALIPPRACGAHNTGCAERIRELAEATMPSAFDPVPEAVAEAILRDACPYTSPPGLIEQREASPVMYAPPNCDGNRSVPRASFPPYVTDDREDDEGDLAEPARYPPGVACSITGECE